MAWTIVLARTAQRSLKKIDPISIKRINCFLNERVRAEPRSLGEALAGPLSGFWKYRVGDFRLICEIHDSKLVVLVVEIGNRREIYR